MEKILDYFKNQKIFSLVLKIVALAWIASDLVSLIVSLANGGSGLLIVEGLLHLAVIGAIGYVLFFCQEKSHIFVPVLIIWICYELLLYVYRAPDQFVGLFDNLKYSSFCWIVYHFVSILGSLAMAGGIVLVFIDYLMKKPQLFKIANYLFLGALAAFILGVLFIVLDYIIKEISFGTIIILLFNQIANVASIGLFIFGVNHLHDKNNA